MTTLQEILSALKDSSPESIALVSRAYEFTKCAHEGQLRKSGEPYFVHPAAIALSLAKLGMDATTIAAGLLHDTIEDGVATDEEVERVFGSEVYFLVDGVTKLGKLKYHGIERHAESLRRLLVATSKDVRVIVIKLMDRMNNMQSLQYVRPDKQQRIAQETLEIYTPLADRLGMGLVKRDLEDLAFPYVEPKQYEQAKAILQAKRKELDVLLEKVARTLKKEMGLNGITDFHTEIRVKGLYSLWKKLQRKEGDLTKVYDAIALRVIVPTVDECYQVLKIVHSLWRPIPGRIKDYIALPKLNGYQSLHTNVLIGNGMSVEIQIRTEEMHQYAQFGIAAHMNYKKLANNASKKAFEGLSLSWLQNIAPALFGFKKEMTEATANVKQDAPKWLQDMVAAHTSLLSSEEFLQHLKEDSFSDRIFVFTPKGDVIDLPVHSTGIDFAYTIHSDLGNHLHGVKVNGKLVSFETELENGQMVEIMQKESAKPSVKWLEFAKTTIARRHIRLATDTPALVPEKVASPRKRGLHQVAPKTKKEKKTKA